MQIDGGAGTSWTELPGGMNEPVHQTLKIFFSVLGQSGIICAQHLPNEHCADLGLGLQAGQVKQLPVTSGVKMNIFFLFLEVQQQREEDAKQCWHKDTALFYAALDVEGFR